MRGATEALRRLRGVVTWLREHTFAADSLLAGGLTVLALVIHASAVDFDVDTPVRDPSWWTPLPVIAATLPVMARRRWPLATLAVVFGAQAICEILYIAGPGWLAVLVAIYSVGAHTQGRRRQLGVTLLGAAFAVLLVLGVADDDVTAVEAVATLAICTAALVLGDNVRRRREHLESLADRAERAERERDLVARERVAEERTRIARELHDIVAHSVSVMVIQATAARRQMDARPAAAEALLANIEHSGRQTMGELRQVLGLLRDADAARSAVPLPSLADLQPLVDAHGGLPVRLAVTGSVDDVPPGVGLAAYRVVQEALTNANRHAGPMASVEVRVRCADAGVEVCVEDDGRGASAGHDGEGYGLMGMRERVAASGGTLSAGPRPGGGWRVAARIPLSSSATSTIDRTAAELAS